MDDKRRFYWLLTIVFAAAVGLIILLHFFPVWHVVSDLAGISAVGALFGALFQLARDRIAHERAVQLEEGKNRFTVGAMSHMASVAFDKHVKFCEEYTEEMHAALRTLFRRGPHIEALPHADKLSEIRTKWALWLTPELQVMLGKFEGAIRKIGSRAQLLEVDSKAWSDETPKAKAFNANRAKIVNEMYTEFAEVVGMPKWDGKDVSDELAIATILKELRHVLGVEELTHLRSELVKRALANLKDSA